MAASAAEVATDHQPSRISKRLTSPGAAGIVLALFYGALLLSLREKSATADEPGHAAAGYTYWKFNDYRFDPENGNLSKRWIALPLLFTKQQFPAPTTSAWQGANSWRLAEAWFHRLGNDVEKMLFRGRAMAGWVAMMMGAAVWLWSRYLFGPAGGMLSLLLYVLNPTILANGGLMTSDTPAAFGFLLSVGCIWATLQRISLLRMLASTVAIGGLFLAKMSAILVLPIALILIVARIADGRPLPLGRHVTLHRRAHQAAAMACVVALQAGGVGAMVWAFHGFRYEAFSPEGPTPQRFFAPWQRALGIPQPLVLLNQLDLTPAQKAEAGTLFGTYNAPVDWDYNILREFEKFHRGSLSAKQAAQLDQLLSVPPPHWVPRLIDSVRKRRLLPEAFLHGYAHVWRTSDRLAAFLNGEIRDTGWRSFFPYTFAVKTPLALFGIMGIGLFTTLALGRRNTTGPHRLHHAWGHVYAILPLAVLFVLYWAFAIASHFNIGHRHLLPIYPPLFILCGIVAIGFTDRDRLAEFSRPTRPRLRVAVIGLIGIMALETALWFPNYLAYFNGIVRPRDAHRHLVDSSLDWGQELPAIARYLRNHSAQPAYLAYFGVGSPPYYGIKAHLIGGMPGEERKLFPPLKHLPDASEPGMLKFLREHPDYDPDLIFTLKAADGSPVGVAMTMRGSALRLRGGVYIISASMLQPLYMGKVTGYWNEGQERDYRMLEEIVRPFLSDDRAVKVRAMATRQLHEWVSIFEDYYDFRLARLTAYLRKRGPDTTINFSVLVYHLTDDEVARALNEPVP